MTSIIWQCKSQQTFHSFSTGVLGRDATGGSAYEFHAMQSLRSTFNLSLDSRVVRRPNEGIISYWRRINKYRIEADLVIKDLQTAAFTQSKLSIPQIAVIHHIELGKLKREPKYRFLVCLLTKQLKRMTKVVVVSEVWRDWFATRGITNTEVIYNSFDLAEFEIDEIDRQRFRQEHGIPSDRPLVYIGNSNADKGVEEVYRELRNKNYTLVMSGRSNDLNLPVKHFNLPRKEYLTLLSLCDLVITMSTMSEGWNRVAHEAMLCKTPVIGSGTGGMRELLEMGGQIVLSDFVELPGIVSEVISGGTEQGARGFESLKRFDMEYFGSAWNQLVERLITALPRN